jgi:hypothetical protein
MKKIAFLIIAAIISLQAYAQQQKDNDTIISNNPANLKLKVLYFHITNRCNTCRSIEANVRKTLEDHFKNEVETGIIDLYVMNCELPENQLLVKKYEAYGATLAVTSYRKGKEQKTEDLTTWAFQKTHSPEIFIGELKSKIEEYLK